MTTLENQPLTIADGSNWHFVNSGWKEGENHLLEVSGNTPRSEGDEALLHQYAFHRRLCYQDVCMRFEFLLTAHSNAGVILCTGSESHFYLLQFPNTGQAYRAQQFWAAFSWMDETGLDPVTKAVPGRNLSLCESYDREVSGHPPVCISHRPDD